MIPVKSGGKFRLEVQWKSAILFGSTGMKTEPPLEAVHIDRSEGSTEICRSILTNQYVSLFPLSRFQTPFYILTNQFASLFPMSRFKTPFHLGGKLEKGK